MSKMQIVYAREEIPSIFSKSLFLAGCSIRCNTPPEYNWRPKALEILEQLSYDGVVFVPLPRDGKAGFNWDAQVAWEQEAMNCSDMIVFWMPRDLEHLPGFTSNVEFGQRMALGNVVLGCPDDAVKMDYLLWMAHHYGIKTYNTLENTLDYAVKSLGTGDLRGIMGPGQRQIPLCIWNTTQFQDWFKAQIKYGNFIMKAQVLVDHKIGPGKRIHFFQGIEVTMWIEAEQRAANPEIIFMRPDISSVIAYRKHDDLMQTEILLVKEFRPPCSNAEAMIYEAPSGSSPMPQTARLVAMNELYEEAGLYIENDRLKEVGSRQLAATALTHKAHVFCVELTEKEINLLKEQQASNVSFGLKEDKEHTFVQVMTLRQILSHELLDWSNVGMIFAALNKSYYK